MSHPAIYTGGLLAPSSPSEAFIFRLPDELLLDILKLAICLPPISPPHTRPRNLSDRNTQDLSEWKIQALLERQACSLARTCCRFNRIATPLLYTFIQIGETQKAMRLHRTLKMYPQRGENCRVLYINLTGPGWTVRHSDIPKYFFIVNDIVSWCTNLCRFRIRTSFKDDGTWSFLRRIANQLRKQKVPVEHFGVEDGHPYSRLDFGPIAENIDLPFLKSLEVSITKHKDQDRPFKLPPEKLRNAPFTSLSLTYYAHMPISTALFLQWPKALTHLSITIRRDGGPLGYAWHSMFLIHKDTLKSVYISNRLPRGSSDDEELFPASAFPNLETLGISQWKTPRDLHFSPADADALLGPKLKTFVWDFRIAKRGLRASSPFGEPEELWLRGLVKAVMTRNASIRRIHIDIGNLEPDSLESPLETGYSWGALDKMCVDFRPFGIICSYGREPF